MDSQCFLQLPEHLKGIEDDECRHDERKNGREEQPALDCKGAFAGHLASQRRGTNGDPFGQLGLDGALDFNEFLLN